MFEEERIIETYLDYAVALLYELGGDKWKVEIPEDTFYFDSRENMVDFMRGNVHIWEALGLI